MNLKKKVIKDLVKYRLQLISKFSPRRAATIAFDLFCTPVSNPSLPTPELINQATTFQFYSDQERIHGYRWNDGQPIKILIVHGFSSSIKKLTHLVEPFVKRGYEVTALDAPAHGLSTGKRINALTYTNCLKNYMKVYGSVNGIIAHSLGGLATMLTLKDLPQNEPIKTVLFAPATESLTQLNLFVKYFGLSTKVRDEIVQIIKEKTNLDITAVSITESIPHVKGPIYWFHDKQDPITPFDEAEKVATNGYPNVQFYSTEGLGHSKIYKDSLINEKVLEFLNFN